MAQATKRVLIVDDEPDVRLTLSSIFAKLGHDVRSAQDGFSALESIRETQPDIILSDLNMPGMSGFELLSVVRRRLPYIYVIATSGAYSGETVPEDIAADAFYGKASGFDTLLRIMSDATESPLPPARSDCESPLIWISQHENDPASGSRLIINCPECLRNSPEVKADVPGKIHETECSYCETSIRYAIIRPLDSTTAQANQQGLKPSIAQPLSAARTAFVPSGGLMVRS